MTRCWNCSIEWHLSLLDSIRSKIISKFHKYPFISSLTLSRDSATENRAISKVCTSDYGGGASGIGSGVWSGPRSAGTSVQGHTGESGGRASRKPKSCPPYHSENQREHNRKYISFRRSSIIKKCAIRTAIIDGLVEWSRVVFCYANIWNIVLGQNDIPVAILIENLKWYYL